MEYSSTQYVGMTLNKMATYTVGPPNGINSADLFFVERFSSLGGSKCTVGIVLGL